MKYTPEGGQITVASAVVDDEIEPGSAHWMRIDVIDTGAGIAPEFHDKIFQELTRLQPNEASGAGIGLAISQSLASALGGRITMVSELGAGSTFTLWLPLPNRLEPTISPLQ